MTFSRDGRRLARLVSKAGRPDPGPSSSSGMSRRRRVLRSLLDLLGVMPEAVRLQPGREPPGRGSARAEDLGHVDREGREGDRHERRSFTDVAYSPDGRTLAGATFTGWIGFWDPATGVRGKTLGGHRGEIHRIGFSPDGRRLVSGGPRPGDPDLGRRDRRPSSTSCGVMSPRIWDVGLRPRRPSPGIRRLPRRHGQVLGRERAQESIELKDDRPSTMEPADVRAGLQSRRAESSSAAQAAGTLQAWDPAGGTSLYRIENQSRQRPGVGRDRPGVGRARDAG